MECGIIYEKMAMQAGDDEWMIMSGLTNIKQYIVILTDT